LRHNMDYCDRMAANTAKSVETIEGIDPLGTFGHAEATLKGSRTSAGLQIRAGNVA
jgi:hypothetical protein